MVDCILHDMSRSFSRLYSKYRASLHSAGATSACSSSPGPLQRPLRADADGAVELQPSLSLVCRPEHGRPGLERQDLHQESRTYSCRRYCQKVILIGFWNWPGIMSFSQMSISRCTAHMDGFTWSNRSANLGEMGDEGRAWIGLPPPPNRIKANRLRSPSRAKKSRPVADRGPVRSGWL